MQVEEIQFSAQVDFCREARELADDVVEIARPVQVRISRQVKSDMWLKLRILWHFYPVKSMILMWFLNTVLTDKAHLTKPSDKVILLNTKYYPEVKYASSS